MDEYLYAFRMKLHDLRMNGKESQQTYCLAVLLDVDAEDGSYVSLSEAEKAAFKSYVYTELGNLYDLTEDGEQAEEHYLKALKAGEKSGDPQAIYRPLHLLGLLKYLQKNSEQAVNYFQQSMLYATGIWPYNLVSTLEWIAMSYQLEPATTSQAIVFYDWICRIKPAPLETMIERFQCLLLVGRTEEVISAAKNVASDACYAFASSVAANVALKRKRKACSAAKMGLEAAIAGGYKHWEHCFHNFIY